MQPSEIAGVLDFLRSAERLKDTFRSGWTAEGHRESAAEHTWRLCLMALVLSPRYPEIDLGRLLGICIVHDLGEAIGGDVPAVAQKPGTDKTAREREDLLALVAPLPTALRERITGLWDEYADARTPEARLAKALDKLETILQHNQGRNPPDFDYRFNLDYGRAVTAGDPLVEALRAVLDRETARRAEEAQEPEGGRSP